MSKRSLNIGINDSLQQKENIGNNGYNPFLEHNQQPKKLCRTTYMQNSENTSFCETDALVCQYSRGEYQCSTSRSLADDFVVEHFDNELYTTTYMQNSENTSLFQTDALVCQYSLGEYQCSTSRSFADDSVVEHSDNDNILDMTTLEKNFDSCDTKGKKILSLQRCWKCS